MNLISFQSLVSSFENASWRVTALISCCLRRTKLCRFCGLILVWSYTSVSCYIPPNRLTSTSRFDISDMHSELWVDCNGWANNSRLWTVYHHFKNYQLYFWGTVIEYFDESLANQQSYIRQMPGNINQTHHVFISVVNEYTVLCKLVTNN